MRLRTLSILDHRLVGGQFEPLEQPANGLGVFGSDPESDPAAPDHPDPGQSESGIAISFPHPNRPTTVDDPLRANDDDDESHGTVSADDQAANALKPSP